MRDAMPRIGAFVALGDSFTEGLGDPYPDGTGYRGWADRFAERLAADRPGLRYANLAVRGRLLREVADDQVPRAVAMAPDLVSLAAGGNDLLRPRADPDALAQVFDDAVVRLAPAGCNGLPVRPQVLVFTGFDPRTFPLIRLIRGKAAAYNTTCGRCARSRTRARGARTGCTWRPTATAGWRCARARSSGCPSTRTGASRSPVRPRWPPRPGPRSCPGIPPGPGRPYG